MNDKRRAKAPEKIPSGIEGFDEITCGGLPLGCTTLLMGGPGCGRTVLALQTLVSATAHHGMPRIFVAFEENARRVGRVVAPPSAVGLSSRSHLMNRLP